MKVHKLLPNLYVSCYPDEKTLMNERFDVIVTMCAKGLPDELRRYCTAHLHNPVSDSSQIPGLIPPVDYPVAYVVEAVKRGAKTLVHCYLGRNRSWLVATLAFAKLQGVQPQTAYLYAKGVYPGCLKNEAFVEYLCSDRANSR